MGFRGRGKREGLTLHEDPPCSLDIKRGKLNVHSDPVRYDRGSHLPDENLEAQRG